MLTSWYTTSVGTGAEVRLGAVVAGVVVVVVEVVVVLDVVVVVVVGANVVDVVDVVVEVEVVVGSDKFRMSCENPNAAWRPAAAPASGGRVGTGSAGLAGADTAAVRLLLGENAAKAATANRAMTTHVANASSRVNLKGLRLLNMTTRCQHAWSRAKP